MRAMRAKSATPRERPAKRPFGDLRTADLETKIEQIEARIQAIDSAMLDPAVYEDAAECRKLSDEREALNSDLMPLEEEWSRRD